jgi:hypothetical protein
MTIILNGTGKGISRQQLNRRKTVHRDYIRIVMRAFFFMTIATALLVECDAQESPAPDTQSAVAKETAPPSTPPAEANVEPSTLKSDEWIQLFNGRNLEGWRENKFKHKPEWKVINGVLTGHGGQGYLSWLEQFDDFELYAEARISDTAGRRGNSGIYFRCAPHVDKQQEFPPGYEAQMDHGDSNNPTGSIYALKIEGAHAPQPATNDGEWFTLRIRAVGNHLQTWVNGKPGADCRDPEHRHKKGRILLQMHHLTSKVEFREVRIRKIAKIY